MNYAKYTHKKIYLLKRISTENERNFMPKMQEPLNSKRHNNKRQFKIHNLPVRSLQLSRDEMQRNNKQKWFMNPKKTACF